MTTACPVPVIVGDYIRIYHPQPDIYTGSDTLHYHPGTVYQHWQPNDHTFAKGPDGRWHCFGITRPCDCEDDRVHEGEGLCFHAVAPPGPLADALEPDSWIDQPKLDVSGCGWAPVIVKIGDVYSIIGSGVGRAESADLYHWTDKGKLAVKGGNRDPNVLFWDSVYYLVRCNNSSVLLTTSADFVEWSEPVEIFVSERPTRNCESPILLHYDKWFYLFWCLWDSCPPAGEKLLTYDHRTYVYASDTPFDFQDREPIAQLNAHAPEVFQDEAGDWFISSAEHPQRGINLARLEWRIPQSEHADHRDPAIPPGHARDVRR